MSSYENYILGVILKGQEDIPQAFLIENIPNQAREESWRSIRWFHAGSWFPQGSAHLNLTRSFRDEGGARGWVWGVAPSASEESVGLQGRPEAARRTERARRCPAAPHGPRRPGRTHRGRASRARRRSCPGQRRARPAARAACRTGACAPRARRGPRGSPPLPPPSRPWLGCRRRGPGPGRNAEPRPLRGSAMPLHNRGNPASTTAAKTAARAESEPRLGGAHVTHSATPRRGPWARPARPGTGSPGPGFPLQVGFRFSTVLSFLRLWDVSEETKQRVRGGERPAAQN